MADHVIVLPGGGYRRHAPHEGEPVAAWLRGLGLEASVFAYPVLTRHPGVLDAVRGVLMRGDWPDWPALAYAGAASCAIGAVGAALVLRLAPRYPKMAV